MLIFLSPFSAKGPAPKRYTKPEPVSTAAGKPVRIFALFLSIYITPSSSLSFSLFRLRHLPQYNTNDPNNSRNTNNSNSICWLRSAR